MAIIIGLGVTNKTGVERGMTREGYVTNDPARVITSDYEQSDIQDLIVDTLSDDPARNYAKAEDAKKAAAGSKENINIIEQKPPKKQEEKKSNIWGWILGGLAVAGVVIYAGNNKKGKKKRKK